MDPQTFREHLDGLTGNLAAQDPDLARTDWASHARTLDSIVGDCAWLLDHHEQLESISDSQTTAHRLRIHLVDRCAAAAALLHAGLRMKDAKPILERCAAIAPNVGDQQLYAAGVQHPDDFTRAIRASWLFHTGHHDQARRLAASLRSAPPAIAQLALHIEQAPTPVDSAPSTFTLNGFGLKFYGGYDPQPDGSQVRVRFLTALFIPLLPIDAYRLHEDGEHYFVHGKVRLGPIMRAWQFAALGLTALAIVCALTVSWLDSPERKLRKQIDEIAAIEARDPATALTRYEQLAAEYVPQLEGDDGEAELQRIAERWVSLATAGVADPITPAAVDSVAAIVARYAALPRRMQSGKLSDPFVDRLLGWADQIGAETTASADASLDLLSAAGRFASASRKPQVEQRMRSTRIALAELLATDWPLEAVRQYGRLLDDSQARAAMEQILSQLPRSPTLLFEIGDEIRGWARAGVGDPALAKDLIEQVEQAGALIEDPERIALLQSGDEAALRAALEGDSADQPSRPGDQADQHLVVALADILRGRGEIDDALTLLDALGRPGLMTHDAQYLYASLEFERGHLDQAAALLEQMLGNRLPAFEDARRAFDAEIDALQERLISQAEQGNIPAKHRSALTGEDQSAAQRAFSAWMQEEFERSPVLAGLQAAYARQSDIVPVAVLLGTVQLQRARLVDGDERQRLLDSAEATFLAIRGEAGGLPSYHLSLAQVYHRLGKAAEGDAEFQILINDPDPGVQLLAAAGYRDLGQVQRAREISETIHAAASSPGKESAARFRSLLAYDIDEREIWLRRADQNEEYIKTSLLDLEGDKLLRAGEFAAADAKYAQVYELFYAQAEREHGSFNNAALALLSRHACTGDLRHVDKALELMKKSVALTPDDAIVLQNYASILDFRAVLDLLDRFVSTKGLRINQGEASFLLGELYQSSLHERLVAAVREAPGRARALEVYAQLEVLAPQLPSPYGAQLNWHLMSDNDEALAKLAERLRNASGLDTSNAARAHLERRSGERDEQTLADLTTSLEARAAVRAKTTRASAAIRAVLLHLDGNDLDARARVHGISEQGLTDARAAVSAFEQAHEQWPEGLGSGELADSLLLVAIYELATNDEDLRGYWTEHVRVDGMTMTLLGMIDDRPETIAALARHPAFLRSLELRGRKLDLGLGLLDLLVAKIAQDQALHARSLTELTRPRLQLVFELGILLQPYDDAGPRSLALLEAERQR